MAPKHHPSNKKDKIKAKPSSSAPAATPRPDWPPLHPILPASDLYLESLLDNQIYLIRNFFTANLCKNYVSFLSSLPLVTTPRKPKRDEAVRVNDRFQIEDRAFAETLWKATALRELVTDYPIVDSDDEKVAEGPNDEDARKRLQRQKIWGGKPLGLNPNIRIYRYSPGQFFAQHCM